MTNSYCFPLHFARHSFFPVLMRFLTFQSMPFAAPQGPPGSCNGLTLIACWRTEAVPSRMIGDPPVSTAVLVSEKIDLTHTNISAHCSMCLTEHAHNHCSGFSGFLSAHTAPWVYLLVLWLRGASERETIHSNPLVGYGSLDRRYPTDCSIIQRFIKSVIWVGFLFFFIALSGSISSILA